MFSGEVTFLENIDEKLSTLRKQIQRSSGDVDRAWNRLKVIVEQKETIKKIAVGRISIGPMTDKRSTSLSEEKLRKLLE